MKKSKTTIKKLFQAKQDRRTDLARLPVEEKVKILIQLQKMASPIFAARGLIRKPWPL